MIQARFLTSLSSRAMVGRAVATIVWSSAARNIASITPTRMVRISAWLTARGAVAAMVSGLFIVKEARSIRKDGNGLPAAAGKPQAAQTSRCRGGVVCLRWMRRRRWRRQRSHHDDLGAGRSALEEIDHVIVVESDAARGDVQADRPRLAGAMDAI